MYDQLDKLLHLPIWLIAGSRDYDAGTQDSQETQDRLVQLGSNVSRLTILPTDHAGLQTAPFTTAMMSWIMNQSTTSFNGTSP